MAKTKKPKKSNWLAGLTPSIRSLGIEMTDTKIKAVETNHLGNGKFNVEHYSEILLPSGSIEDGKIMDASAVLQTLHTLVSRRAGMEKKHVHFVLPSSLTMIRFTKVPDVEGKSLKRLIEYELMYNIPLPFENPYYDFIKLPGSPQAPRTKSKNLLPLPARKSKQAKEEIAFGSLEAAAASQVNVVDPAALCDVMIAAAPLEAIHEYTGLLQTAGLNLRSIEVKPLSLYRAVERLRPVDPLSTFMTVDITETYTDVSVFFAGALRISRNIQVTFRDKFDLDNAVPELTAEIERLLSFFHYTLKHREQELECILVSGDMVFLENIVELMRERFAYRIDILSAQQVKSKSGVFHQHIASYAVPLGLSLRGRQV